MKRRKTMSIVEHRGNEILFVLGTNENGDQESMPVAGMNKNIDYTIPEGFFKTEETEEISNYFLKIFGVDSKKVPVVKQKEVENFHYKICMDKLKDYLN
tara:strand:+ start:157 stop:453 length:297 start_codon:yes stop_codon:yes gene_type:complete